MRIDDVEFKALLVGNHTFDEGAGLVPLKGPPNDLQHMEDALTHPDAGLFAKDDVQVLLDANARDINLAIDDFFDSALHRNHLLFYYSGHGIKDVTNRLYFCARDSRKDRIRATGIDASWVRAMMDASAARCIVVVLDCCHSGRFKDGGDVCEPFAGEGRFILTSSRGEELAVDDELSPFTGLITEALLLGEVDTDGDDYISINEVYEYVLPRLRERHGMSPQRTFDKVIGDAILGRAFVGPPEVHKDPSVAPAPRDTRPDTEEEPAPSLVVSPTEIRTEEVPFGERPGDVIVDVINEGGGKLDWKAESDSDWVEVTAYHNYIKLELFPRPGDNEATVTVRDRGEGGEAKVSVRSSMLRDEPPELVVVPAEVDLGTLSLGGDAAKETVQLDNAGGGNLTPKVGEVSPGLDAKIVGDSHLMITFFPRREERFEGTVRVEGNGGTVDIPVRAVVEARPVLQVEPREIDFGDVPDRKRARREVTVRNAGSGELEWEHSINSGDFFSVERRPEGLRVKLHKRPGHHRGSIRIESNGGEATVQVSANIREAAPIAPPAPNVAGIWRGPTGALQIFPAGNFVEYNALGMAIGEGAVTQNGPNVRLQGVNAIFGPFWIDLVLQGNALVGTFQGSPVQFVRG